MLPDALECGAVERIVAVMRGFVKRVNQRLSPVTEAKAGGLPRILRFRVGAVPAGTGPRRRYRCSSSHSNITFY